MQKYARIINGCAVDVTAAPHEKFHAELLAEFVEVPSQVEHGWTLDGAIWSAPVMPDPTEAPAPLLDLLTPMTFYLAFKPSERIAIKASDDANVKEFWFTYELAVKLNKPVDPNLPSVRDGLLYLTVPKDADPPGPGILTPDRVPDILAGKPQ